MLQAGSTTDQLGEVMFAHDSVFSSAVGCDINALIGSKGGHRCERIKRREERTLTEYLFVPGMISFRFYDNVRRIIIFSLSRQNLRLREVYCLVQGHRARGGTD